MNIFDNTIAKISQDHLKKLKDFTDSDDIDGYVKYFKLYNDSHLFLIITILELYSNEGKVYYKEDYEKIIINQLQYNIKSYIDKNYNINTNANKNTNNLSIKLNNIIKTLYKYSKNDLIEFIAIKLVSRLPTINAKREFTIKDKNFRSKWNNKDKLCIFIKKSITSGLIGATSIENILYMYLQKIEK
jgi:hypothetical protein